MREANGKLTFGPRSRTGVLYIPSGLMVDSTFPFKVPANLKVKIQGKQLIIEEMQ